MYFPKILSIILLLSTSSFAADHFYTTDSTGELAPSLGYKSEGIACHAWASSSAAVVPVYRWVSRSEHFYTTDANENPRQAGYTYEGIGFYVLRDRGDGALGQVPFFRWYNSKSGDHFYTTDPNGELAVQAGYKYEGILGWVVTGAGKDTVPVYRWFKG